MSNRRLFVVIETSHSSRALQVEASSRDEAMAKAARGEISVYGEYRDGPAHRWIAAYHYE